MKITARRPHTAGFSQTAGGYGGHMSSIVEICNLALSHIGKNNISALDEASAEARACKQFYAVTVRRMLAAFAWRFALKAKSMAEVTNDRVGTWGYAYAMPSDCVNVIRIREPFSSSPVVPSETIRAMMPGGWPYDIAGGVVYCDLSPAMLEYASDVQDPSRFPDLFEEALSWHLAARLAMPLTRDPSIRKMAFETAAQMQRSAEAADANDVRETADVGSDYERARFDGSATAERIRT